MENISKSAQAPAGFSYLLIFQYHAAGRETTTDREHSWENKQTNKPTTTKTETEDAILKKQKKDI